MSDPLSVLFLDNADSFTYNLVDEFAKRGAAVTVVRNDRPADEVLSRADAVDLLVVSPGPGTPEQAGCCLPVTRGALGRVPLFGVCLGHQALILAEGGTVARAPAPIHGRSVPIVHGGVTPFEGLDTPMPVGRYHSLGATRLPRSLQVTAETDGLAMAVAHRVVPAIGVQFHPESLLTPLGGRLIENVIAWARHAGR